MKHLTQNQASNALATHALRLVADLGELPRQLITRFGETIDVRNRGALRMSRFAGSNSEPKDAPAVVRLWTADQCRELTSHQARAIAAQLLAAATLADSQNNH
ncbi:MAG: hypothetical protein V4805_03585 [Pseudomonadota bacterium]